MMEAIDNATSNDNDFAIPILFTFPSSRIGKDDDFMMPSGVDWQIRKVPTWGACF